MQRFSILELLSPFIDFLNHEFYMVSAHLPEFEQRKVQVIHPKFSVWEFLFEIEKYRTTAEKWFAILFKVWHKRRNELYSTALASGVS